ncbi:MAG: ABC transporter substrate-binding protein [Burkholderiaceae bacterium]
MKRRMLCSWLAAAVTAGTSILAISAAAPARAADALDLVKVGAPVSIADSAIFVAIEKGYFREQKIQVEVKPLTSSTIAVTALASGDLDVSGGSAGGSVVNAIRQGLDIRLVADKGSSPPGHGYLAFLVRPELAGKLNSAADLRGRNVAVTGWGAGAASEVMVGRLLAQSGLADSELRFINISFADILAGLGTGRVDLGLLVEPLVSQAVQKGVGVVWKRVDEIYPNQQYTAVFYGPGIIRRPDVADRFMKAYLQGARFYNEGLKRRGSPQWDELVSILIKHTSVKDRSLYDKMVFPGINPDGHLNTTGIRDDMAWFVKAGRMKEAVDIGKVVDHGYVDRALKTLGRYQP